MTDEIDESIQRLAEVSAELADTLRSNLKSANEHTTTQSVIHSTESVSIWLAVLLSVAITACIATWLGLYFVHSELRDAKAWVDLHSSQIARLQQEKVK